MKNRTVLGIICILLAIVLMFAVVPWLSRKKDKSVPTVVAAVDIARGTKITEKMVKTVSLPSEYRQEHALSEVSLAVGQYAGCDMFSGDILTNEKLKENADGASDALYRLRDGEFAMTVSFSTPTKGFSGQLENGDVVRIFMQDAKEAVVSPKELRYLRVITTLTQSGESRDAAKVGTTGQEKASSVMFAVNDAQAALLFRYAAENKVFCAFVCHGSDPRAAGYLAEQDRYFAEAEKEAAGSSAIAATEEQTDGN